MLRAKKHKLFESRMIHFWIRIWSDRCDGYRVGYEAWDDQNTTNGEGYKNWCPDAFDAYIINFEIILLLFSLTPF